LRSFTAGDEAEQITINMQAVPTVDVFGRVFQIANPFALWSDRPNHVEARIGPLNAETMPA
jgi:hypothetical protein